MATPFLKWPGGKSQLAARLQLLFPSQLDGYIEPFVGGGAVFFHLNALGLIQGRVLLADVNAELINAYTVVRDKVDSLIKCLKAHKKQHCKDYYYEVRATPYVPGVPGAARTIYLNKTGFNGLYRVNSRGLFNVPIGSYVNPSVYNEAGLRNASEALRDVELVVRPFNETIDHADSTDFMYLDPPYVPLSPTASFTSYAPGGFGLRHQEELAQCLRGAHSRGVMFALSNSASDVVVELYRGFRQTRIDAVRRINCDGQKRGSIEELVVMSYHGEDVSAIAAAGVA